MTLTTWSLQVQSFISFLHFSPGPPFYSFSGDNELPGAPGSPILTCSHFFLFLSLSLECPVLIAHLEHSFSSVVSPVPLLYPKLCINKGPLEGPYYVAHAR